MKKLTALLMLAVPACAQAMWPGDHMGMAYGMRPPHPLGLHVAVLLYGAMAALGYFVLQHIVAQKEAPKCLAAVGRITGLLILLVGLGGMLCGVMAHVKMACHSKCCPGTDPALTANKSEQALPPGDPKWTAPKGPAPAKDAKAQPKSK